MISNDHTRSATIVASKPSSEKGTVVLYRVRIAEFRDMLGEDKVIALRGRMQAIIKVIDALSGVNTKLRKGKRTLLWMPHSSTEWLHSRIYLH